MKLKKVLSGFLSAAILATTTAIVMPLEASAAETDTSNWQVVFCGFTSGWGGWSSVSSSHGTLTFETTTQAVMDANSISDISEFGGFGLQVWGANIGDEVIYSLKIEGSDGTVKLEKANQLHTFASKEESGQTVTDAQITQVQGKATGGNIEFAADDKLSASVKVSDGSVEKPTPGVDVELADGQYTIGKNEWNTGSGTDWNWQTLIPIENAGLDIDTKVSDLPVLMQVKFIVGDCSADASALSYGLTFYAEDSSGNSPWINPKGTVTKDAETGMITVLADFTDDISANPNHLFKELRLCVSADKSTSTEPIEFVIGEKQVVEVESVEVTPATLALKVGDAAAALTATVAPAEADQGVTWTTSDSKIATVSPDGKVTAVATGEAKITAISTADETKKAECTVTVTNPATKIAIPTTASVLVNKTQTLAVTTTPEKSDALDYTWTSSKLEVATVADGVVTGVAAGEAIITVTATNSEGKKLTAECTVTVTEEEKPITELKLDKTTATLEEGETVTLTATATPKDTTDEIEWVSSDTTVATVKDGVVTAVKAGKTNITVQVKGNTAVKDVCAVEVTAKAPEIETKPYTLKVIDASSWGEAGVTKAAQANVPVTTLKGFTVGTTTYKDVKNKTLKLENLGFGSCTATGVTAENVDVCIYLQFGSGWTWCATGGNTLADGTVEYDLSTLAANGVKDADVLQAIGFQFNIKGNAGGINDMALDSKVTLNAAEPKFSVVGEEEPPAEPSDYETGKSETVEDYTKVDAIKGTKTELQVNSITAADAAKYSSYDVTVTVTLKDGTKKEATKSVSDCYKGFKYNNGLKDTTVTAAEGYFIIVKITNVPADATVTMSIKGVE